MSDSPGDVKKYPWESLVWDDLSPNYLSTNYALYPNLGRKIQSSVSVPCMSTTYVCRTYGCPERPARYLPFKCYTCGQEVK